MTWMKAAIVGKDDEQFLGEEKDSSLLKAAAEPLAKPSIPAAKALAAPSTVGMKAKPVKALVPASPLVTTASGSLPGKPPAKPAVKPALVPAAGVKPLVKPSLLTSPVSARSEAAVRPALPAKPRQ
jgi:hypothetical protein